MNKIKFISKSLLIENRKKILVIGDLHLGYEESLRRNGVLLPSQIYHEIINDFEEIFLETGKVDKIIVLGDLKHEFGKILKDEWKEILDLIDFLRTKTREIIIVKGNHDIFTGFVTNKKNIEIVDYYLYEEFAFLHGDRDFGEIIRDKNVKYWIIGHAHPAITIQSEVRKEKYKCFLEGKYKSKNIIILPSFFPVIEGTDPRDFDLGLAWDFDLNKFEVKIINGKEVLDFGKLGKI